ncbi:type IX secretion system sortase PorU [Sediminibacterium ginsengisoli]|uniref:Por secretion system C-terminal sorting domain-containing protein n=1 Tax=Sediminibacterium ginsengisoli TaxID=413434 RepID=A0A1T4N649_9BACT|nr:type IX secretion system sortase PorU [Sediminibacterium ginsengisoli]SJZ74555.1 Por secretion system C-terminal sorting domain-containing protein [Sediminibacterium ginsengisoli]
MILKRLLIVVLLSGAVFTASAQRRYAAHSVLASGSWARIGVTRGGVYKVDLPLLTSLGLASGSISSAGVRLYGNGGAMLEENNSIIPQDDLTENAIEMSDGGDGIFNGSDYFLFYAPGPHQWVKDSINQQFSHRKNRYADTVYYYITIGGNGKRISPQGSSPVANRTVNSYDERYYLENDLVNLLSSGKEWYGEEFNAGTSSRHFTVSWSGFVPGEPVGIRADIAARTVGAASSFRLGVNNQPVQTVSLPGVSGSFLDMYAIATNASGTFIPAQAALDVGFTFLPGTAGAQAWLNWFELHGRKSLAVTGSEQLFFRDWRSVAAGSVAGFTVTNAPAGSVAWDITNLADPVKMNIALNNGQLSFTNDAARLREYVVFNSSNLLQPFAAGKMVNQDLHGSSAADYLVVTHPAFLNEARRLAAFHEQHHGLKTLVVTTEQVFNEFGSGNADPVAIRDFVKMFYDRAAGNQALMPKYLLLFGAGSYDPRYRLKDNTNFVPCYESVNSLDPLVTYNTDDFFGMLDDSDDINNITTPAALDLGIGRIPARSASDATVMVNKIVRYHNRQSMGSWRNQSVFVADDGDNNLHLYDTESLTTAAAATNPLQNQQKVYLDAFPLVSGSGGARYPAVNEAIVNSVTDGALFLNYSGHGSYQRLSEEAVLTADELARFSNADRLPLFITASCDFAPYDDPLKKSLGDQVLMGGENGAIALLTTTRLVFAYSNRIINEQYLRAALQPDANGRYPTLGESVMRGKNNTVQVSGDYLNPRKFALLGDPALRLAIPEQKVVITTINNQPLTGNDTLRALGNYTIGGEVRAISGSRLSSFNGMLNVVVYDKPAELRTRGNSAGSQPAGFRQQQNILYRGSASVTNGLFRFSFVLPLDLSFLPGRARISLYATDSVRDAAGTDTSFVIRATAVAGTDNEGPVIQPYLNDTLFRNGGLTHEQPLLLARLSDSSGINTSGNGIGHDITVTIDGDERNVQVLNAYYTADPDTYRSGTVRYRMPVLSPGRHWLVIKAWDVANHSGQARLDFEVARKDTLVVTRVRNYPNPFTTSTTFSFEHNQQAALLDVQVVIYSMNGRLVKRIARQVNTTGTRTAALNWDGMDEHGRKLEKGVYIYRVMIRKGDASYEDAGQLILL